MDDVRIEPPADWRVSQLRLTALTSAVSSPEVGLWAKLIGQQPASITRQAATQTLREEGAYDQGLFVVSQTIGRCDLALAAAPGSGLPILADADVATSSFRQVAGAFIASPIRPNLRRLAYGAVYLAPVATRSAGYEILARYLPRFHFNDGLTDFLLQLNFRRRSTCVPSLEINRLTKWSALLSQVNLVAFDPSGVPVQIQQGEKLYACRCELDISTAQEAHMPPDADAIDLVDEFIALGREILEKGPVP